VLRLPFVKKETMDKYDYLKERAWVNNQYEKFILDMRAIIQESNSQVFLIAEKYLQSDDNNFSCLELGYVTYMILEESGNIPVVSKEARLKTFADLRKQNPQNYFNQVMASLKRTNPNIANLYNGVEQLDKNCGLHIYSSLEAQILLNKNRILKEKQLVEDKDFFQGDLWSNIQIARALDEYELADEIEKFQNK